MKKLLLAAVSFAVFTLNGLDRVQLAAVIAFSAGVFAGRWFSPDRKWEASAQIGFTPSRVGSDYLSAFRLRRRSASAFRLSKRRSGLRG